MRPSSFWFSAILSGYVTGWRRTTPCFVLRAGSGNLRFDLGFRLPSQSSAGRIRLRPACAGRRAANDPRAPEEGSTIHGALGRVAFVTLLASRFSIESQWSYYRTRVKSIPGVRLCLSLPQACDPLVQDRLAARLKLNESDSHPLRPRISHSAHGSDGHDAVQDSQSDLGLPGRVRTPLQSSHSGYGHEFALPGAFPTLCR
jgi:hypothetical protein